MRTIYTFAILASLALCLLCSSTLQAAKPSVVDALNKRISVEFVETPLVEVLDQLSEKADVEITFDEKYLPERSQRDDNPFKVPVGPNPFAGAECQDPFAPLNGPFQGTDDKSQPAATSEPSEKQSSKVDPLPVWLTAQDISLRSALTLIVEQHQFVYQLQAGKIAVLPEHDVEPVMITKVYQAEEFSLPYDNGGRDLDRELNYLIINLIAPNTWEEVGGEGTINEFGSTIVVTNNEEVHREIRILLKALQTADQRQRHAGNKAKKSEENNEQLPTAGVFVQHAEQLARETQLRERLQQEIEEVEIGELPLSAALDQLAELSAVPLFLDRDSQQLRRSRADAIVSLSTTECTLSEALAELLAPLQLHFVVRHEVVVITAEEKMAEYYTTAVYPIADLLTTSEVVNHESPDALIEVLLACDSHNKWDDYGGTGILTYFVPTQCLVIHQRPEVHRQLSSLLSELHDNEGHSPQQRAQRKQQWEEELVWQGFAWNDHARPGMFGWYGGFGRGVQQGGFFNVESEQLAQVGGGFGGQAAGGKQAGSQQQTPQQPEPPEPMSKEESAALKKMITEVLGCPKAKDYLLLLRDHDILVRHRREVLIDLERKLYEAPIGTTMQPQWKPYETRSMNHSHRMFVPVVGQRPSASELRR